MNTTTRPNYAGLRRWARQRETGTVTAIYDADVAGMDVEAGKWCVVCEDHGYLVNVDDLKTAEGVAAHPGYNFCDDCQAILVERGTY